MEQREPYAMLEEIHSQPAVLEHLLERFPEIQKIARDLGAVRRIVVTGCGDPFFASRTAAYLIEQSTGLRVDSSRSMEMRWLCHTLTKETLVVASTVSGRTPRTIEAARLAKKAGAPVLAITDNPDSPISDEAKWTLHLNTSPLESLTVHSYSGYQNVVPQTKTYTAALLAMLLTGACLIPEDKRVSFLQQLEDVPRRMGVFLKSESDRILSLGKDLASFQNYVVLGSGPWLGTASYGFAKLLEFAIPARYQCLEEYNHLEAFLSDQSTCIFFLAPDSASMQRAEELIPEYPALGSRSVVIAPQSEKNEQAEPLVQLPQGMGPWCMALMLPLPSQLLALGIALGKNRNPNQWLGGVRTDLIQTLSQKTIRGSKIRTED